MLPTNDAAFGFGQGVTGGTSSTSTMIQAANKSELKRELNNLSASSSTPTVLTLTGDNYDFTGEEAFTIGVKNLTITAQSGTNVTLTNLGLVLNLTQIDNILIQGLAFISDGTGPADGILFDGTGNGTGKLSDDDSGSTIGSQVTNRVRITHCTFNGYKDDAIEIRGFRSLLLATIDHCFFVDSHAGERPPFKDRGALNIASVILTPSQQGQRAQRATANSFVTVAFNFFAEVWRRSPRAAASGTHAHIFNNLLYRWGYQEGGVTDEKSWNGMSIGALENQTGLPMPMAVIQANRFIPWDEKQSGAIMLDSGTQVDIGPADLGNRFDKPNGKKDDNSGLAPNPVPAHTIDVNSWYTSLKDPNGVSLGLTAPQVTAAENVNWVKLGRRSGPVQFTPPVPEEVKQ